MRRLAPGAAAFLDRDGTINVKAAEGDYITAPDQVRLLPGAAGAIRALNDAGVLAIVVTNQRGIARGRMTEADLAAVHDRLAALLHDAAGARLDAVFHCPHGDGECDCRKPACGLLRAADRALPGIDRRRSLLIGDAASDVEAARRFGIPGVRLGVDADDLAHAVAAALDGGAFDARPAVGVSAA